MFHKITKTSCPSLGHALLINGKTFRRSDINFRLNCESTLHYLRGWSLKRSHKPKNLIDPRPLYFYELKLFRQSEASSEKIELVCTYIQQKVQYLQDICNYLLDLLSAAIICKLFWWLTQTLFLSLFFRTVHCHLQYNVLHLNAMYQK